MPSLVRLRSPIRPAAEWLLQLGKQWGGPGLRVTSVLRSWAEQDQLYNRFKRGLSKLPVAPPGHSLHQYGLAFDMARLGEIRRRADVALFQTKVGGRAPFRHWVRSHAGPAPHLAELRLQRAHLRAIARRRGRGPPTLGSRSNR